MTSGDLLGEAVEELYSADPEEFTRRRGELTAQARSAGQAAAARQIAALRKPTRSAWVINQLARSDPGAASRLAALGEELRAAERSGDGTGMRELSQARRQLIAALVRQALAASGQQAASAALREEITATLAAALADPEVAGQIQQATLLRPARRMGFGTAQAPVLALVPPPPDARQAGVREAKPARARADAEQARAEAEQAQAEAEQAQAEAEQARAEGERDRRARARAEAEQALADADRAVHAARTAEQELQDTARHLEQQLTDLRRRLQDARAAARQAEIAQRKARQVLGRLPE